MSPGVFKFSTVPEPFAKNALNARTYNGGVLIITAAALLLLQTAPTELRDGLLALRDGNVSVACARLESAARAEPSNAVVWAALAQAYVKSQRREEAVKAASEAERLGSGDPAIQHALAMFYAGVGEPAKAAGFEQKYAASQQADEDALARAARLYLRGGDAPHAVEAARAALARHDQPALHNLLGSAYEADGNRKLAMVELREAVRLDPASEEYAFDLAQELLRAEDFAGAAVSLEAAAKNFPSSPQISLALGVAYYGLRRFPEATQAFVKTIDRAPEVEQPYVFLGKMLDQAGSELPRIQAKFEAFHRRDPSNYLGGFLAAKALLLSAGEPLRVEGLLRESIARKSDFWEAHAELGDLLSRRKDYAGAATELQQAASLNPTEASIHFRLARVYDRLDQPERAQAERALHQKLSAAAKPGMDARTP